jgi:hypothetical protein
LILTAWNEPKLALSELTKLKNLEINMTNYVIETNGNPYLPTLAGPFRLILGMTMMIAGLYFGLFTEITGHGLGLLFFIVSPFVFLTDKKRTF